ncbi:MAG: M15 family metallopeptidase [Phormidesmis sp.]
MSNDLDNDIPIARRQPTQIPLAEANATAKRPNSRRHDSTQQGLGLSLSILTVVGAAAGTFGLGVWQWEKISAWLDPHLNGVKAVVASADLRISSTAPETTASPDKTADSAERLAGHSADAKADPPPELLHHRRYDEAPQSDLVLLNPNSEIKLQPVAQATVTTMIAQAKAEGVRLGIISGFRNREDQNYLYFDVKAERGESAKTRAEVSAPPGYSEHHTGYAVDFIDESQPHTHLEESFETTAAYQWLIKNAAFYNFEMSFPDDPASPLGYEPWHWRYVGDQRSLEIFYKE